MALTGGPGTGKTTSLRGILSLYDSLRIETLLTAPTGRAAKDVYKRQSGSYTSAFIMVMAFNVLGIVAMLLAKPPRKKQN